jgi:hypothetical protein
MLEIIFKKSKSKNYEGALNIALAMGGETIYGGVRLVVPEYKLLNAYRDLFPLVEIIGKWKGTSAKFRGKPVNLFRFIFMQYHRVGECGECKTESGDKNYCDHEFDVPNWGCKQIINVLSRNSGPGEYKRSGVFWYNYGHFDSAGVWWIDKDWLFSKLMQEIEEKALDVCPYFDIERIKKVVYNDLPGFIIPDNYNYRLFYVPIKENGKEVIKALNIRHIESYESAPGLDNKKLLKSIKSINDFFRVYPPKMPKRLQKLIIADIQHDLIPDVFDDDGLCKN